MPGESPLSMMRPSRQRLHKPAAAPPVAGKAKPSAAAPARRRPLWRILVPVAIVVALVPGWVWGWYYSAAVADRTLAGWIEREAAGGRIYSCGSQAVGGFPLRIEVHCADAEAQVNSYHPPFAVKAKDVTFTARVYRPTLLVGDVTGPLSLFESNEAPRLVADWSRAQVSVRGLPPDPDSVSFMLDRPRLDRAGAAGAAADAGELLFRAEHVEFHGRVVAGSPRNHPVIEAELRLTAATAPTLHPLVAEPIQAEGDAVLRGFTDLSPKSWAARFREMQAAGGSIEIKHLRIARSDAIVVGAGTLNVNPHGKLDGLIRIAVVGVERIVPLLGIDQLIGRGVDRLAGVDNASTQGLAALDRLMPGLGGTLRNTANASVIENLKKMGEPTEIDHKPAIVLPLRFSDGAIYLGMLPLGDAPALF